MRLHMSYSTHLFCLHLVLDRQSGMHPPASPAASPFLPCRLVESSFVRLIPDSVSCSCLLSVAVWSGSCHCHCHRQSTRPAFHPDRNVQTALHCTVSLYIAMSRARPVALVSFALLCSALLWPPRRVASPSRRRQSRVPAPLFGAVTVTDGRRTDRQKEGVREPLAAHVAKWNLWKWQDAEDRHNTYHSCSYPQLCIIPRPILFM